MYCEELRGNMGRKKGRTIESYEKDQRALELRKEGHTPQPAERRSLLNRGLTYGYLGKRVESERDIRKAKELGYVP